MPEPRVVGLAGGRIRRRDPHDVAIGIFVEAAVREIAVDPVELPEMVGNVLAGVGHQPVALDEDLVGGKVVVVGGRVGIFSPHDPASGVFPPGFEVNRSRGLHHLEGVRPEVALEHFAFPWHDVVGDPEPVHRSKQGFEIPHCHVFGHLRDRTAAGLDGVLCLGAEREFLGVLASLGIAVPVPHADAGIEIPAVVVERVGNRLDLFKGVRLEMKETDDDVGNLDTGVVDVILDLDPVTGRAQDSYDRIAEH